MSCAGDAVSEPNYIFIAHFLYSCYNICWC